MLVLEKAGGGGEWESNPPIATELRHTGFEDQESHQTLCASARDYNTSLRLLLTASLLLLTLARR